VDRNEDPGKHDRFTLDPPPTVDELEKLMAILARKNVSHHTKQAAVWIVTDNVNYDGLGSLRTAPAGGGSDTRSINEPEAAEVMRLCAEAGIDLKTRAIWRDRKEILAGLKDGDLKNWLKTISTAAAPAPAQ
jgi:hypothetical protein